MEIIHSINGNGKSHFRDVTMPDITSYGHTKIHTPLNRVGMSGVELPVRMRNQYGELMTLAARANFYVSLDDPTAKGIHMSRLYLTAQQLLGKQEIGTKTVIELLREFIKSQRGLSNQSWVHIWFDLMVQRQSLLSGQAGWRYYPVSFTGYMDKKSVILDKSVRITYSSTCPCSGALARQVVQKEFKKKFAHQPVVDSETVFHWLGSDAGMPATPHGQRSFADVKIRLKDFAHSMSFVELIDLLENGLQTPVQTAVKREDEQEFAKINGGNLMFCEDAARILKAVLEAESRVADYRITVQHLESLHAHDAVAIVTKGVPYGFQPE